MHTLQGGKLQIEKIWAQFTNARSATLSSSMSATMSASISRTEWPGTNYVLLRSSHFHLCPHSSWSLAGWLVTQFQMSRKLWSRRRRSNYPRKKCPNHLPSLLPYIIGFDAIYFWYPDTSGKLCFSFFLLAIKKLKLFTLVNRLSWDQTNLPKVNIELNQKIPHKFISNF